MSPEDASRLTLGELEAIIGRLKVAMDTYREAMAVLGGNWALQAGPNQAVPLLAPQPALPAGMELRSRQEYGTAVMSTSPILMTPERKEYLDSIRADPQRASLLAQFRKDGPAQEESVRTEMLEAFGGGT